MTWRDMLTSESYVTKAKNTFHGEIVGDDDKLWHAAKNINVEEVRRLSNSIFVDVNYVKGSETPLFVAANNASSHSQINVIQLLLGSGADPNLSNDYGFTPLHWAGRHGNINVMKLLLDKGANPNSETNGGWTPLHECAGSGDGKMIQLLLKAGAKPNKMSNWGSTPLSLAQQCMRWDIYRILNEALKQQ